MDNYHSQMGLAAKQLSERYAEYAGTAHDQGVYYPYEPSSPAQGHHHLVSTKHHYGGGNQKNNAAMSALTLLAFLFFLHILQQCLKDHMTAMSTPQVMIMTGGREGEENIAKQSHSKIDKTGEVDIDTTNKRSSFQESNTEMTNSDNYLKITTSEDAVWSKSSKSQKYRNNFNKNTAFPDTVDQPGKY